MPPYLHPRSKMTSSLFATTVVASFLVVGLPHMLPCPVPATKFADGEVMVDEKGRRKRYRRKDAATASDQHRDGLIQFGDESGDDRGPARVRRECPVPKPGGILGEWLGFHSESKEQERRPER